VHVPYKGASALIPDAVSGQIAIAVMSAPPALAQARAGRLRPIGLTSSAKLVEAPEWPAIADTLPGFDAAPRVFMLAPADTANAIVMRLNEALKTVLSSKDVLESFSKQGATPIYSSPAALGAELAADVRLWSEVAKASGAKAE